MIWKVTSQAHYALQYAQHIRSIKDRWEENETACHLWIKPDEYGNSENVHKARHISRSELLIGAFATLKFTGKYDNERK